MAKVYAKCCAKWSYSGIWFKLWQIQIINTVQHSVLLALVGEYLTMEKESKYFVSETAN